MATTMQLSIDCADPECLVRFWATALGYVAEAPPEGFPDWRAYWLHHGVPEEELGDGDCADSVVDPDGVGPRLWFQQVPEGKSVKNRLHLDLKVGGGLSVPLETRRQRVDAEVERLLAAGASRQRVLFTEGSDHYGVTMQDPEGNEFCLC
ncbi:VOC family protein [Streptomyces armeniacus]|uniref:VOC family protein n=1 Tax=Streptomyces armeniacus TaxID=83291 RepID=A0A345XME2_9ACTN|nr:VOC family protein [Streptomyces armeniacus]AXK32808.1 VOC family protein [Streptomyces armeniacus]